ncbi:MAG: hypothetical protein ACJ713_16845 [Candidatus Sulfotelmatobacter sp.]
MRCTALDREAFSIPNYDLKVQIDPAQHRLGVRGNLKLRNDTATPQKIAVLQISSSLDWRSIKIGDKTVQFVTQPFTSDIDHTGALSEAIVTLPDAVSPRSTVELQIAYEGVITLDQTRLTRIGTPEALAKSADWDSISPEFTAVRGVGYVAWYPIATEVANLSEGNSLLDVVARWKSRQTGSRANFKIAIIGPDSGPSLRILLNEVGCSSATDQGGRPEEKAVDCTFESLGSSVPTFVIGLLGMVDRSGVTVFNLPSHAVAGEVYVDAAGKVSPLITDWFGRARRKALIVDLPDTSDAPFESGPVLLTPLSESEFASGLSAAHQLAHACVSSSRPWVEEGLAHFAQALYVEQQKGRPAAIEYMSAHRPALIKMEQTNAPSAANEADSSLVNSNGDEFYRSKAMSVWWMLRDMIGDSALKKAIAAYRPEQDKEPSYMPRLIAAQTQRDLEWLFDDWVYRDRGLPDFKIESAYSRKAMSNAFMVTVTVENVGSAGAEVPILVKFAEGAASKRLEVRAKSKATIRIETSGIPQEITVNDGSVPESDTTNNTVKVEVPQG